MLGMPIAVAAVVIMLAALILLVTAGAVLNLFIHKQETITVVATHPPAHSTAWLPDSERGDTPGSPDTRPFFVLAATMGLCPVIPGSV